MVKKILWQTRAIRFFHWVFAAAVVTMIINGFYIAFPFVGSSVWNMKLAHLLKSSSAFIAMGAWVGRVYYGVASGNKDMIFKFSDFRELIEVIRYYFYRRPALPPHAKYNAAQRLIFSSWYFFYPFMFLTGLILLWPNVWYKFSPFFVLPTVRLLHFTLAFWYAATTPLHIYLAFTEDPAKLQAIFTGWVRKN